PKTVRPRVVVRQDFRFPDRAGIRLVALLVALAGGNIDPGAVEAVVGFLREKEEKLIVAGRTVLRRLGHRCTLTLLGFDLYQRFPPDPRPPTGPWRPRRRADELAERRVGHGEMKTKRHAHLGLVGDAGHEMLEEFRLGAEALGVSATAGIEAA